MLPAMGWSRFWFVIPAAFLVQACASNPKSPTYATVGSGVSERSGINASSLVAPAAWTMPEGTSLDDGVTEDEAIAVALWNNPDFHVALTELGIARADLITAGHDPEPGPVAALSVGTETIRDDAELAHWRCCGSGPGASPTHN